MSRSVSYATGSVWILYTHVDYGADDEPDEWAWDDFKDNLIATFRARFPSLYTADKWLDREDHAILQNDHAWIGLSEYCGLVSVWCVPKDRDSAIARHWCESINDTAASALESFAERLYRVATFSNGESLFRSVHA